MYQREWRPVLLILRAASHLWCLKWDHPRRLLAPTSHVRPPILIMLPLGNTEGWGRMTTATRSPNGSYIQPKPSPRSPSPTAFYSCPYTSYSASDSRSTEEEEKTQEEEENIQQSHTAASSQLIALFSSQHPPFQCFLGPTAEPNSFSLLQNASSFLKCGGHQRTLSTRPS